MNNLHAPSKAVFLIALALVILALLGYFVTIPFVTQFQFWLAVLGYVVLALGCLL
jgi:antibiotic biosynthesis monooxygenase (ABM) superfamily enzyme